MYGSVQAFIAICFHGSSEGLGSGTETGATRERGTSCLCKQKRRQVEFSGVSIFRLETMMQQMALMTLHTELHRAASSSGRLGAWTLVS